MCHDEKLPTSRKNKPLFGVCCLQGKIDLPPLNPIPDKINELLILNTKEAKDFRSSIRLYNSILAFTSSSAQVDDSLMKANSGAYTYRINRSVHHKISNYLAYPDKKPHFSQIYIYDADMQAQFRKDMFPHKICKTINADIFNTIQHFLELNNPYVNIYRQAGKLITNNPQPQLNIVIKADVRTDRTKNKSTCNEIAVLMVDDDQTTSGKRTCGNEEIFSQMTL